MAEERSAAGSAPGPDDGYRDEEWNAAAKRADEFEAGGASAVEDGAGDPDGALDPGEGDDPSLPSLDSLVQRIPDEAKRALDRHLRGKFVAVRRVDPEKLR